MNHSFDTEDAKKYGVPQAIILQNFRHWTEYNRAHGTNIHDGRVWTFNSVKAYAEIFPYFTADQIRRYIESLEEAGAIVVGNFNKRGGDRTKWHSLAGDEGLAIRRDCQSNWQNSQTQMAKLPNGNGEIATPLPDINSDVNHIENTKDQSTKDNPLSKPRLKPNASALCVEALDAFNSQILKRKGQPDYTMWPAWVALTGDEQAVFETVMGIIHASQIPDGPRLPFALDGVFRDAARQAYWQQHYKKPVINQHEEIDWDAQTMRELENMTEAERAERFDWYHKNGLIPPQEAQKRWKHLLQTLKKLNQSSVA